MAVCASGNTAFWTRRGDNINPSVSVGILSGARKVSIKEAVCCIVTHVLPRIFASGPNTWASRAHKQEVRQTSSCIGVGFG